MWRAFKPVNKFKILCGFYMIASRVDVVYQVALPYQVKRVLVAMSQAFSIGLTGIGTPLECIGLGGFRFKLLAFTIAPGAAALLIALLAAVWLLCTRGRVTPKAWMEAGLPWVLRVFFLAYPSIVNVAFDAFPCYTLCVDSATPCASTRYLMTDPNVQCGGEEHVSILTVAWVAIVIYPVGLLALNALLLVSARHAILTGK